VVARRGTVWRIICRPTIVRPEIQESEVADDPELQALVAQYRAPVDAYADVIIGRAGMDFDGNRDPGLRTQEMPLGNLVTDVMLAATQLTDHTVAALTNGGAIRASINAGEVTFGDAVTVLPFGNTLVALDVTGMELVASLDNGLSWAYDGSATRADGAFPQVAGLVVSYCGATVEAIHAGSTPPDCPAALRPDGVVTALSVAGAPVDLSATYRVAINDYLAGGGDYYDALQTACERSTGYCRDTGVLVLDEFVNEFASHSPVSRAIEGRLLAE
jgi:2',3'-cyclic-nucleotide 2'-phosphodiesterase (5'-nucleotidase family)